MSKPYPISITKTGDAIVCSIDMWKDVQEKIDRFFAEMTEEEAVRQLSEIGFERVVRCRDCTYRRRAWNGHTPNFTDHFFCAYTGGHEVKPDGFCAWGCRK